MATPGDLIRDPKRTPFNIGQRLNLTDFAWEEALPLADGLGVPTQEAQQILQWVLNWTEGHPYLTQRLFCAITEEAKSDWSEAELERIVRSTFFGAMSQQDNNVQFVRDMLTKRAPDLFGVLTAYRKIYKGKGSVQDEEQSLIKSHLKLSGIVRSESNLLQVRNRIYKEIFDNRWIKENLPIPSKILTLQTVFIISTFVTAVTLGMRELGWLQPWELRAYDQMMLSRPPEPPDNRILLVRITEKDLQRYKSPLSDEIFNKLLKKIKSYQPRVIGLQIKPSEKANLGVGIGKDNNIIAACAFESMGRPEVAPPPNFSEDNIAFSDLIPDYESDLIRDNNFDNVIRRSLLFMTPFSDSKCNTGYSFASTLAINYLYKTDYGFDKDNAFYIGKVTFPRLQRNSGGYKNIDDRGYQLLINYRNLRNVANTVTLTEVLTGKINSHLIKDRLVIIGTDARSLNSGFLTPYSTSEEKAPTISPLFIHAQITSQLISAVLDKRPLIEYFPEWVEALWAWLWSFVGSVIVWQLGYKWKSYLVFGISIVGLIGVCYILFIQASWMPLVPPVIAFIISGLSVGSISYLILIRVNRK